VSWLQRTLPQAALNLDPPPQHTPLSPCPQAGPANIDELVSALERKLALGQGNAAAADVSGLDTVYWCGLRVLL
jgi:hypothetical protein